METEFFPTSLPSQPQPSPHPSVEPVTIHPTPEQQAVYQQMYHQLQQDLRQEFHNVVESGVPPSLRAPKDDQLPSILARLLPKPALFYGEHGLKVVDWCKQMDYIFHNERNATEEQKMDFAVQCMRGEGFRFWMNLLKEIEVAERRKAIDPDYDGKDTPKKVTTWNDMKKVLQEYFCPRGASEAARNELHNLSQRSFPTLAAYCDYFEAVAGRIDSKGQDLTDEFVTTFKNGLADGRVRLAVTQAMSNNQTPTLYKACQAALQAESDIQLSSYGFSRQQVQHNQRRQPMQHRNSYGQFYSQHGYNPFSNANHRAPMSSSYQSSSQSSSSHDTSAPMDLTFVSNSYKRAHPDEYEPGEIDPCLGQQYWKINNIQEESDQEQDEPYQSPDPPSQETPTDADDSATSSFDGSSDQVNFIGKRANNFGNQRCWNCGNNNHLVLACPHLKYRPKPKSQGSSGSASSSKPASKKF